MVEKAIENIRKTPFKDRITILEGEAGRSLVEFK